MKATVVLAIDAGNTRIKWGVHDGRAWTITGVLPTAESGRVGDGWASLARIDRAVACNVAGADVERNLVAACARHRISLAMATSRAEQLGVVNGYRDPAQLGADRWAALVAAWRRSTAVDLFPPACVVVNAGTAVTVDALDSDGVFRGGLILPGMRLMLQALAENTAGLRVAPGESAGDPHQRAGQDENPGAGAPHATPPLTLRSETQGGSQKSQNGSSWTRVVTSEAILA